MTTRYDRRGAEEARRSILDSRNRFWKLADIDAPTSTAQHLLADLVRRGELRHIRKGLYWRGTKTPLGMAPPPPPTLAAELAGRPGIGPAGLSAANALRLSTQIPRRAEYAIPARPPAGGEALRFVNRSARRGRIESALSSADVAALEVLDGWDRLIETAPDEAMGRLSKLITAGDIDAGRLAGASITEPGASRTRLRYLLRKSGLTELAEQVPAADPRTEARALAGLAAA